MFLSVNKLNWKFVDVGNTPRALMIGLFFTSTIIINDTCPSDAFWQLKLKSVKCINVKINDFKLYTCMNASS